MSISSINAVKKVSEGEKSKAPPSSMALMTVKELAQRLDVAESTIWSWIDKNGKHFVPDFPCPLKIGRNCTRWREKDVEAYLAKSAGVSHVE